MKMKKLIAAILCLAMVCAMVTVPALAASADLKSDTVLTEATVGGKKGITVDWQVTTGASKIYAANITYAFDTSVFDLVDANGTVQTPVAGTACNAAQLNDGGGTAVWNMSADLFYEPGVTDGTALVTIVRGTMGEYAAPTAATLGQFHLAYKDGKSAADVTRDALREATPAEANAAGQSAVVQMGDLDGFTDVLYGAAAGEDTPGFASHITFGKGFTFHDPAELTDVVITGSTSALIPAVGGANTENTYSAKGVDQYGNDFASTVTLALKGTAPEGVSFDGSKLTVASTAQAGSITLTATATAGDVTKTKDLVVTLSSMTVAFPTTPIEITYGDKASAVASQVTATGSAGSATIQGTVTAKEDTVVAIDAATVPVIFTATTAPYTGTTVEGAVPVKVNKKALTVTADAAKVTYTYAVAADALTWTVADADLVDAADKAGITVVLTTTDYTAGSDVGEYAITGTATSDKYVVTVTPGTLTVEPRDITTVGVTAADAAYTGVAAKPALTTAVGLTLTADKDYTVASTDVNVGPATATVTGIGNYTGTTTVSFQITQVDVTGKTPVITGTAKSGQTVTAEIEGVVNADAEMTFAWYYTVNGDTALVEGATGASLKLTSDLVGAQLTVKATAKGVNYVGETELSEAVTVSKASAGRPSSNRGDSTTTPAGLPFVDVAESDWFYKDVEAAYNSKLMNGTDETHFSPNLTTSRAMIATILWRVAGEPEAVIKIADFPDVEADSWYIKAVRWAAEKEIVMGFETGNFGPNQDITREQLAVMLYRYNNWKNGETAAEGDLTDFADSESVSDWAKDAVVWATQKGIITGKPGSLLDPQGTATRAEAVTMLQRYVK